MIKVDLNNIPLNEFTAKENPGQHCRASFPWLGFNGTKQSAAVYVELEPGDELGTHTDSAEEILLILEGEIEAQVGDEKGKAGRHEMVLVPQMLPHNFRNIGTGTAKVLGFFGGANQIVATFENVWLPTESNMVDTSMLA